MTHFVFVTGTDTGVGKTVLACALTRWLRRNGMNAVALKPLASGDRLDAEALQSAQDGALDLDVINPWFFPEPVTPLLAARRERRVINPETLVLRIKSAARLGNPVIVEGGGGLLSPLLKDFDAPEIISALKARPIIVAADRLGVINQVRLVWQALPRPARKFAQVVLMAPRVRDASTGTNGGLLGQFVGPERLHLCPWWAPEQLESAPDRASGATFARLRSGLGLDY